MGEETGYAGFVWAAYALTFLILGVTVLASVLRHRKLRRLDSE